MADLKKSLSDQDDENNKVSDGVDKSPFKSAFLTPGEEDKVGDMN